MSVKGRSGINSEERLKQKTFEKIRADCRQIADYKVEHMRAYDIDGNKLVDRTDNEPHSVGFGTSEEWAKTAWNTAVHNHPSGHIFSGADINAAKFLREIWAVTSERIHIFRWNYNSKHPNYDAQKVANFYAMVEEMHNGGKFFKSAKEEWESKHGKLDYSKPFKEWEKDMNAREAGIERLTKQKEIEFFKNHQKEYGYTYSARSWGKKK